MAPVSEEFTRVHVCVKHYLPAIKLRSVRLSVTRGYEVGYFTGTDSGDRLCHRYICDDTTFDQVVRRYKCADSHFQGMEPTPVLELLVESMMELDAKEKSFMVEQRYEAPVVNSDWEYGRKQKVTMQSSTVKEIVAAVTKPEGKLVVF